MADRARGLLPALTFVLLIAAWWLSLVIIWRTPIANLTPPKILILGAVPVLIIARSWKLIGRADRPMVAVVAAYILWLVLTGVLRASTYDVKLTVGYSVYFGGAYGLAYSAARARPNGAAVAIVGAVLVGLALTLVGVGLERFTYPSAGAADPLAQIWAFVRPQHGAIEPGFGPPPLHTPSGDPRVPRVSSWFAQANYLAYFMVLVASLSATMLLAMLHLGRRRAAALLAVGLAGCVVTVVWTYSRAGMIGLLAVVASVVVLDTIRDPVGWRSRAKLLLRAAPLALVIAVLGASLLADSVGLRRFTPLVSVPGQTSGGQTQAIEKSAAQAGAIRGAMQSAALKMVAEDPQSLLLGPGQDTFAIAVHDPTSPYYIRDAIGVNDSNSLWLSVGVSGGITADLLLALALGLTWIRVLLAARGTLAGARGWLLCGLAAWMPTWALLQFAGTFPFNPSEAMILGTLLGVAVAQSGRDHQAALDPSTMAVE